ncbi:Holliday junction resolvase RuvX [Haploplasma modicum]|uniref:Holliday junction resolvase RuvX n=1 Tax=Haploplasma modicum TaxID=2150 RepID=UPI0004788048|nr:Holliday junction resolvase RuvX [Haploplasma modicum]
MKKYLGIDLGSKSLGFSISLSGIIANSYQTLYFKDDNYEEAVNLTLEVIKKEQITDVVIGLPKHMNNDLGIRGQISIDFANMLKSKIDVNVVLWDERTSTQSAIKAMVSQNVSRKKQKLKKDELAATIILQNYLDYKEKN